MCQKEHSTRSYCAKCNGRLCLTFLFILVASSLLRVSAQLTSPILFHGMILDAETHQPLTGAHFQINDRSAGAANNRGMVSFYARHRDTVRFSCVGYRDFQLVISDTLNLREYVAGIYLSGDTIMIPAVVVTPRLVNMRAEIMAEKPKTDHEMVNAANNLKVSAYQGIAGTNELGDPLTNYELLRQKQRVDAYEKGGIPSDQMVVFSPFVIIPVVYILAKGLPEEPVAPAPFISPGEMNRIRALHDSLIYKSPRP